MALDEPKDDDTVQTEEGFQLVIQNDLLEQVGGLTVDFLKGPFRKGFHVTAESQTGACGPADCSSGSCAC